MDAPDTMQMVEDESVRFHKARKPPFRYQSKGAIAAYSIILIILGLFVFGCGTAAALMLPKYRTRQSYQLENKWMNIIALFAGIASLCLLMKQCITFIAATLVCTATALPLAASMIIIHGVAIYFREQDQDYYGDRYAMTHSRTEKQLLQLSSKLSTTNIVLTFVGVAILIVSYLLQRYALQVASRNYGYRKRVDRQRLRLSILGMAQIVLGALATGCWVALEALFKGQNISNHALPTGEILCHSLVLAAGGYMTMMATSKGNQPVLVAASILAGASFLLSAYFSAYPISALYMIVENSRSSSGYVVVESKAFLAGFLALIYLSLTCTFAYTFLKVAHLAWADFVPRMRVVLTNPRFHRSLRAISMVLFALGMVYGLLELLAVGLFIIYKLDFNALPLFAFSAGIMIHVGVQSTYTSYFIAAFSSLCFCVVLPSRDIYLFAYHMIVGQTPDSNNNMQLTFANIAVHGIQLVVSLTTIGVAITTMVLIWRAIRASMKLEILNSQRSTQRRILFWLSTMQGMLGILCIVLGFYMFVDSKSLYMEDFGDRTIGFGLLLLLTAVLGMQSKKYPLLHILAIVLHMIVLLVLWQESDRMMFLVQNFLQRLPMMEKQDMHENSLFGMSGVILFIFLVAMSHSFAYSLICGYLLENCRFSKANNSTAARSHHTRQEGAGTSSEPTTSRSTEEAKVEQELLRNRNGDELIDIRSVVKKKKPKQRAGLKEILDRPEDQTEQ